MTSASFRLVHRRGAASDLFASSPLDGAPTVVDCRVTAPALVLGSTQPRSLVVPDPGLEVVHRRSGGGAVLIEPDGAVWVDVFVPTGHPLWEQDVGRAFWWLGDAWARTLGALGVGGRIDVHKGALVTTPWSGLVCFAGLGPGEVTVDGRKSVGIAQRRTREGSLFQCALALSWAPERLLALFERSLTPLEQPLARLEQPLEPSERSDRSLTRSEQSLEPLERSLEQSEQPLARSERSDRSLTPSEQSLTPSEQSLTQSERSLTPWEQALARLAAAVHPVGPVPVDEVVARLFEQLPG